MKSPRAIPAFLAWVALTAAVSAPVPAPAQAPAAADTDAPLISRYGVIEDWQSARATTQVLRISAFGRHWQLEFTDNRRFLQSLPARVRQQALRDSRFFSGTITGNPESWVRLNWIDGRLNGGFFDGEDLWLIDGAARLGITPPARARGRPNVIFRLQDLALDGLVDHGGIASKSNSDDSRGGLEYRTFVDSLQQRTVLARGTSQAMPITIVSDTQFSTTHGSNTSAVVAGRINFTDGIYSNQLGTGITLWHHEILDDDGSMTGITDASTLLSGSGGFQEFMRTGDGAAIPFRGLAHLFTGRDLDGNTAGIAFLDVLCSSFFGYGVDQNLSSETISTLVFAHEVGHNFAARHDDNTDFCPADTLEGIMNSSINGSEEFSDCSLDAMGPAAAAAECLVDTETSEGIFADGFE